jgi:hypothetical protein
LVSRPRVYAADADRLNLRFLRVSLSAHASPEDVLVHLRP